MPSGLRCPAGEVLGLRWLDAAEAQRGRDADREPLPRPVLRKVLEFLSAPLPRAGQAVAAGDWHTCALTAAGRLVCFGRNADGQCSVPEGLDEVLTSVALRGKTTASRSTWLLPGDVVDQSIFHGEAAAVIAPQEAALVSQQRWASAVGHSIATAESIGPMTSSEATPNMHRCLLPSTWVLAKQGMQPVTSLSPGDELAPGRPMHEAVIARNHQESLGVH